MDSHRLFLFPFHSYGSSSNQVISEVGFPAPGHLPRPQASCDAWTHKLILAQQTMGGKLQTQEAQGVEAG